MKTRLLKCIFSLIILAGALTSVNNAVAQAPTFGRLSSGLNSNPLTNGTPQTVVYGFSVTSPTGSSFTFSQFYIASTASSDAYFANGTLMRCSTSNYNTGTHTPVGTVVFNGGTVTLKDLTETVTSTTNYYFLVADVIGSGYNQLFVNNMTFAMDVNGNTYSCNGTALNNYYVGYNFNGSTAYPLKVNYASTGLDPTSTTLLAGTSGVAMFGFDLASSTGTINISQLYINSNIGTLSQYFSGFTLYTTGSTATYSVGGRTAVAGTTVTMPGGYVKIVISGSNLQASTTKQYYWLVANINSSITGPMPATPQFYFSTGQLNPSFTSSTSATYNTATAFGPTYSINYSAVTISNLTGGVANGTLTAGATDIVVFGFSLTTSIAGTFSDFNINCNITPGSYFNNFRLYSCTGSTYSVGSRTLVPGTATANGSFVNCANVAQSLTAGSGGTKYYFLVADMYSTAASTTAIFRFANAQSTTAIIQSSPSSSSYNNFTVTGNTLTMPAPTVFITSANSPTTNGISTGALYYGRKDIVLFGFGLQAFGAAATITASSIKVTGVSESNYFSNARLYRSTSPVFPGGTPLYNSSKVAGCNCGFYRVSGITENIPINTTYYYFLVVDYTNGSGATPASITLSYSGQSGFDSEITTSTGTVNTANFSGTPFTIADTEEWTGAGANGNLNNAANYSQHNGGSGFVPGAATVVHIGGTTYTRAPVVNTTMAIGGLAIENNATVALSTSVNNTTLTLNTGLTIASGATLNYTSSFTNGKIALANGAVSSIEPTGRLNLTGNTTIDNSANTTGSFTLKSDVNGTASIGALPTTSSLTGTYVVQRYFTGGSLANRGWRLVSMPVNNNNITGLAASTSTTTTATYNFSSLQTNLLITGPAGTGGGFDQPPGYQAVGGPTVLFYTTSSGLFANLASITTPTAVGTGFYFYFRGDKTTNLNNKVFKVSNVYATPEANVVGLQSGTLNQKDFTYNLSNAGSGYNLIGNPYPSTITVTSAALTGTTGFIYTYDPLHNSMSLPINTATIASGQGFFVQASSASSKIAFTESMKTSTQLVGGSTLLMGTPVSNQEPTISLKLVQDTANADMTQLRFMDTYNKNYDQNEDANDLNATGQAVFFGAMTADNHEVAIASQPLDKQKTSVFLSVNDNNSGLFSISKVNLAGIPDMYDVWLKDHFKNDSLDLRNNSTYNFNIDKSNAATYGNSRLEIVIRKKSLPPYQLITFSGKKVNLNNVLNWSTVNEYTYTSFQLQSSPDGVNFADINDSQSTGSGNYTFSDQASNGDVYYRLKQTDINDKISYSAIVIIKADNGSNVFSVYPNPVGSLLQFSLNQVAGSTLNLRIYNSLGKLMRSSNFTTNSGQQDVSMLTSGSYEVQLIDNSNKKVIASAKFMKL